jgi:hypothetical protein
MILKNHPLRRTAIALTLGLLAATANAAQPAAKPAKAVRQQAAPAFKPILEERALALLKATSARLAAARAMSFTATVSYEYPSKLGPAIVYTSRYDVTMQRPDRLRVINPGDGPASEFYVDGKTMMAFAPAENLVAVAESPPTIDAALKKAYESAAIYFPFTDLILADPYAALAEGAKLAFYIGPSGMVGGVKTDMVAWSNDDVFIQIWIGADDKLPRRLRAVYRADPLRLRHDMELSNWQLDPQLGADTFSSQKALAAERMAFAHPVAAPPPGVKPLMEGKAKPAKSASGSK